MARSARPSLIHSPGLRIAFDARMSLGQYRGMGRYLRSLIAGREDALLGLCADEESDASLRLIAHGYSFHPLWEQVSIPRRLRENRVDLFIAPYNTAPLLLPRRTRLVLIVHDLIFMEPLPRSLSAYQNSGRLYRQVVTPRAVKRAERILTVSHYTAGELCARFDVDPVSVQVIPVSLEPEWFRMPGRREPRGNFVLVVGGEAPSKNLPSALAAFALCRKRLREPELRMKIAGVKPAFHNSFFRHASELGIAHAVEFLPYLSDAEMRELYRRAVMLLMPSLAEGFGIPVLEAMASGLPVASSRECSLPEVGGDAALYFDPRSVEDMAAVLERMLQAPGLLAELSARGRVQARRFHRDAVRPAIDAFWNGVGATEPLTQAGKRVAC
jgi:glycosyltransferase involved in cell wall biosynthesis